MSELKATTVYDAYWKANSVGEGTGVLVYIKSEADKVIAHQKFKRCEAMANYWGLVSALTHGEIQLKCMRRELKWHKLAEKFKEAK